MTFNTEKLMMELQNAGIVYGSCNSNGIVCDVDGMTQIQTRADVSAVLTAHNPDGKTWNEICVKRAELLSACDWTQLNDAILIIEEKTAWQEYRQALRDIPQAFATPDNVVWPIAPGAQ